MRIPASARALGWRTGRRAVDWSARHLKLASYVPMYDYREQLDAKTTLTRDELLKACEGAQVPCGMVAAIDEIFSDPQYRARKNIVDVDDPRAGRLSVAGVVPALRGTPGKIEALAPALGSHNDEVFGQLLGLSEEERTRLATAGVI